MNAHGGRSKAPQVVKLELELSAQSDGGSGAEFASIKAPVVGLEPTQPASYWF